MDYFGPYYCAVGRGREKRYGCIFTCLTIRAVHIEMVHDLTTDGTLMALRRFINRRGKPDDIYSDNGTNLRGAATVLQQCLAEWNQDQLHSSLANKGINWHFLPPGAPHMGGAWERLIRSIKITMDAILPGRKLSDAVLQTVFAEAEGILNSRPLTHVSLDSADDEPLTPNHFLIGQPTLHPMTPQEEDSVCLKKVWRTTQLLADHFWQRWVKEYLPTLVLNKNCAVKNKDVKIGDVVIVADPNGIRATWPKGIIEAVYPGKDGAIRVVDVRTISGLLRRPVTKLCPLMVKKDEAATPGADWPAGRCSDNL
ncbi:Retrotransposon protein [Nesidiocoris tenuis]|uniref:Retrotransposon protein n=2 Tax=Nesidiocoris tenuis TaxID=355587 RepID=A0ABN7B804_9HEMI|nr:Retrotransposon protein [Nesidiocoris tenuis]